MLGRNDRGRCIVLMKIKDITEWSGRWSTPPGTMDSDVPVADRVLVDLSLWGTSIIGLAVDALDGRYFGSIRVQRDVYDRVLEFLKRNTGVNSAKSWMPRLTSPT
jgi:hypothetical protein